MENGTLLSSGIGMFWSVAKHYETACIGSFNVVMVMVTLVRQMTASSSSPGTDSSSVPMTRYGSAVM